MKNKGFTLVELLAVIAILAILVIVAMPNVLGMFNQAKVSSFTTEVQKLMDAATTTFTKDALLNNGKTVYYSSESNATLKTKPLDMIGNKKNYFIEMDRNGNFKRVVVYDSNYCYDVYTNYGGSSIGVVSPSSKLISEGIQKTSVVASDIWEAGDDWIGITYNGTNYFITGCEANVTVEGKKDNQNLETFKINSDEYYYVPGMTWEEWINSSYNTAGLFIHNDIVWQELYVKYLVIDGPLCKDSAYVDGMISRHLYSDDQIVKNTKFSFGNGGESLEDSDAYNGQKYFDCTENGGKLIYNQNVYTWVED